MFTLGHLSDIHIAARAKLKPTRFLNKRLLGGANLLLKRHKKHDNNVAIKALAYLTAKRVDHIAISGDLTNLALSEEYAAAHAIIDQVPNANEYVSVVPGNHDYYIRNNQKFRSFERRFQAHLHSDLPSYQIDDAYPFCKLFGEHVALIGINTGIPTPWFIAQGHVDERQLRALSKLLQDPILEHRAKIVMLHHPLLPFEHTPFQKPRQLRNDKAVLEILRRHDVDVAIHGHNHHFSITPLPHLSGHGTLYVCETSSSSVVDSQDPYFKGGLNIYNFDGPRLASIERHIYDASSQDFALWQQPFDPEMIQDGIG